MIGLKAYWFQRVSFEDVVGILCIYLTGIANYNRDFGSG